MLAALTISLVESNFFFGPYLVVQIKFFCKRKTNQSVLFEMQVLCRHQMLASTYIIGAIFKSSSKLCCGLYSTESLRIYVPERDA